MFYMTKILFSNCLHKSNVEVGTAQVTEIRNEVARTTILLILHGDIFPDGKENSIYIFFRSILTQEWYLQSPGYWWPERPIKSGSRIHGILSYSKLHLKRYMVKYLSSVGRLLHNLVFKAVRSPSNCFGIKPAAVEIYSCQMSRSCKIS